MCDDLYIGFTFSQHERNDENPQLLCQNYRFCSELDKTLTFYHILPLTLRRCWLLLLTCVDMYRQICAMSSQASNMELVKIFLHSSPDTHVILSSITRRANAQTIHIHHTYRTFSKSSHLHNQPSLIFQLLYATSQQSSCYLEWTSRSFKLESSFLFNITLERFSFAVLHSCDLEWKSISIRLISKFRVQ